MSLFEDTNPRALKELLADVHSRTMVLPNFQRDFVWEPSATSELVVSIASNYPAGSLLRVRDSKRAFAVRQFEGAPPLADFRHTFLVLDGQQRLTSLYQAFYGVGEHRYFLDIRKLIDGADFEEAIFHVRASTKWAKEHEKFESQATELLLPLSHLKTGSGGFLKWALNVTNPMLADERTAMLDALTAINDGCIKAIDDYHFPVVTLSDETEPDALCTIFETLNRTGVKLSAFELLTARFWPHDIRLRDLWETALIKHPVIAEFDVDPYYVLQSVALACRPAPSCKRKDVLNMAAADITAWWDKVINGLALGLQILRDDCKVTKPKWLPYQTMLVPLATTLATTAMPSTPETGVKRERIKRWFWCCVFGQAYESSPNSQAARDVSELGVWLEGGAEPATVRELRFDPNALRDITPRQRAVYRGTICLVLGSGTGARDFHTQAVITAKLIDEEGIDDHHVFPSAYLRDTKAIKSTVARDCVLNRTLIDRTTNQIISARAPSDYLATIQATTGFPFDAVLTSHCLPVGASSPLLADDYDAFLEWRQIRLWKEIQRVTGLNVAADLELAADTSQ
jgi:hypothetical protein